MDEVVLFPRVTLRERIVLVPKYFSRSLNNGVGFVKAFSLLLKKIFIDDEITNLYNLSILSDIYNYGSLLEENFLEMVYCIVGYPENEI